MAFRSPLLRTRYQPLSRLQQSNLAQGSKAMGMVLIWEGNARRSIVE